MNNSFGAWSTAITTGANAHLNTFWKRRLSLLPSLSQSATGPTRRTILLVAALALAVLAWPTMKWGIKQRSGIPTGPNGLTVANADKKSSVSSSRRGAAVTIEFLPYPTPAEVAFDTALERPVDVDFVESPLEDCLAVLGRKLDIRFETDREKLLAEGIVLDQPISIEKKGRPLRLVLRELLQPLELDFYFENDRVNISTSVEVEPKSLMIRWYPVWDLYPGVASAAVDSEVRTHPISGPSSSAQDLQSNGGLRKAVRGHSTPTTCDLVLAIKATVAPDSWADDGGIGDINYAREIECLCVRQTQENHHEIVKLLRLWREAKRLKQAATDGRTPKATFMPLRHAEDLNISSIPETRRIDRSVEGKSGHFEMVQFPPESDVAPTDPNGEAG